MDRKRFLDFLHANDYIGDVSVPQPPAMPKYANGGNLRVRGEVGQQNRAYVAPLQRPVIPPPTREAGGGSFTPAQAQDLFLNSTFQNFNEPGEMNQQFLVANDPEIARQMAENKPLGAGTLIRKIGNTAYDRVPPIRYGVDTATSYNDFAQDPSGDTFRTFVQTAIPATNSPEDPYSDSKLGTTQREQMGDAVYRIATGQPQTTYDKFTPDVLIVRWARENPEYWPLLKIIYEQGYGQNPDGSPKYTGGEAIWQFMMEDPAFVGTGLQAALTRYTGDVITDPLGLYTTVRALRRLKRMGDEPIPSP